MRSRKKASRAAAEVLVGAPDIGGQVTGRRDGRRVRRRRCRRRRLRPSRRHGSRRGPVDWRRAGTGPAAGTQPQLALTTATTAATATTGAMRSRLRMRRGGASTPSVTSAMRHDRLTFTRRPHVRNDRTIVGRLSARSRSAELLHRPLEPTCHAGDGSDDDRAGPRQGQTMVIRDTRSGWVVSTRRRWASDH